MDQPNQHPPTSPASSSDHDASSLKGMFWFATAMCVSTAIVMAFFCTICRRNRRLGHSRAAAASAAAAAAAGGLDRDALNAIPVFVYSSDDREAERLECCVCLGEFREREKGRLLPDCRHSFHVDCVDKWFQLNSTCPLCRSAVGARSTELKQGLNVV